MSSSRLFGRGGRGGGDPVRLWNANVMGFSGIGKLEYWGIATGREMETQRLWWPLEEERELRAERCGITLALRGTDASGST
jgi:hypothetical protein